jgi:F1F0 ATPase subunit 2
MTWVAALTTGFGLGLASFGSLWLTVRPLMHWPRQRLVIGASSAVRLLVVVVVLYALAREGAGLLLAGLVGLWLARWSVVWRLEGMPYGH